MKKEEKRQLAWKKMCLGGTMIVFVALWLYFKSVEMALLVLGFLIFLIGFFMAITV